MGAEPRFVEAKIKFVKPGERAIFYPTDRSKSYMPFDDYDVRIGDVRPIAGELSMAKNGFVLLTRPTAVKDFYDPAEIKQVYYPEIERLLGEVLGASRVVVFDATRRSDGAGGAQNRDGLRGPASRVCPD